MNTVKLSLQEFHKLIRNGSFGPHLQKRSAQSYVSNMKSIFLRYGFSEPEYSRFTLADLQALYDLILEDQEQNHVLPNNTFNALQSSQKCFFKYANYKYNGVVVKSRSISRHKIRMICQRTECNSILWRVLNWIFGKRCYRNQ